MYYVCVRVCVGWWDACPHSSLWWLYHEHQCLEGTQCWLWDQGQERQVLQRYHAFAWEPSMLCHCYWPDSCESHPTFSTTSKRWVFFLQRMIANCLPEVKAHIWMAGHPWCKETLCRKACADPFLYDKDKHNGQNFVRIRYNFEFYTLYIFLFFFAALSNGSSTASPKVCITHIYFSNVAILECVIIEIELHSQHC